MDGKVLAWPKNATFKKAKTIAIRHGYLYKLYTEAKQATINEIYDSKEINIEKITKM